MAVACPELWGATPWAPPLTFFVGLRAVPLLLFLPLLGGPLLGCPMLFCQSHDIQYAVPCLSKFGHSPLGRLPVVEGPVNVDFVLPPGVRPCLPWYARIYRYFILEMMS